MSEDIVMKIRRSLFILDHQRAELYEVSENVNWNFLLINRVVFNEKEVRLWKNPRERER